ncbi:hypothetical protein B5V02_32345 [Mesorhizobium kowhaii]|uniref:Uncharacterized protein n=1 Tax=Mesorhizobium kowhaii TaxID=1300272 RepID=A0A2W7BY73_9HYPH|nr:hypothetical protein B5V02_32345 [Mesorhizobium kowhaii]
MGRRYFVKRLRPEVLIGGTGQKARACVGDNHAPETWAGIPGSPNLRGLKIDPYDGLAFNRH